MTDSNNSEESNQSLPIWKKRVTRRKALSTGAGLATGAVAGLIIGGAAGYFAGGAGGGGGIRTVTSTAAGGGGGATVTETMTNTQTVTATGGGGGEPQTITLQTLSNGNTADTSKFAAKLYQAQHPGVTINVNVIDEATMNASTITALQTAPPPDIIYNSTLPALNAQVVDPGFALQLDDYVNAYGWNKASSLFDTFKVNGHYYWFVHGFIYFGNIYYNIDLFNKMGLKAPPQTLDDLYTIGAALKAAGITPLVHGYQTQPEWFVNAFSNWTMNALSPQDYQNFWTYYGPKLKTPDFANRPIKFTDDGIVSMFKVAEDWRDKLLAPGTPTMTDASAVSQFVAQKAGMYMVGSWGATVLEGPVGSAFKYGFWPLSTPPTQGGGKHRTVIFGQTYFVIKNTKSPHLVADYLNTFLSPAAQLDTFVNHGLFPAIPLAPSVTTDPIQQELLNIASNLDFTYSLAAAMATEIHDPLEAALAAILSGQKTAQQAATDMENTATSVNQRG